LYENNADVILGGHDHDYERFAPQNPNGERDDARGIRQFVVGTGGAAPYPFGAPKQNREKRITGPFGFLKITFQTHLDGSQKQNKLSFLDSFRRN